MASTMVPRQGSPPVLAMLVDKTSFDETDSFQVDREALESSDQWSESSESQHGGVMMRNGKVRRRLRWRPKGMEKQKRPLQHPPLPPGPSSATRIPASFLTGSNKRNSSNWSVNGSVTGSVTSMSTISHSSRNSKRSQHSFASTETKVQSNTRKALRFPLPRPSYPNNSDGNTVTTIEDGNVVFSKGAGRKSPLFASADPEEKREDADASSQTSGNSSVGDSGSSRKSGFPPLFKKKIPNKDGRQTPPSPSPLQFRSSTPISDQHPIPGTPLPRLCGEEVEQERRVDLRIRKIKSDDPSQRRDSSQPASSASGLSVSIAELRSLQNSWSDTTGLGLFTKKLLGSPNRPPLPPSFRNSHTMEKIVEGNGSTSTSSTSTTSSSISSSSEQLDQGNPGSTLLQPLVSQRDPTDVSSQTSDHVTDVDEDEDEELVQTMPLVDANEELRFSMSNKAITNTVNSILTGPATSSLRKISNSFFPGLRWGGGSDGHAPLAPEEPGAITTTLSMESRKEKHAPVDLDDSNFLQAEKNLQAIHDMATEHLRREEYDEALEVFEEILRGQLARYGREHYRVATAHHNIGIVHMRRGDYKQATHSYRNAVKVRKKELAPDHPDVAVSQAQLGVAYLERRMHKKAIAAFREALRIRRRCLGSNHPKVAKILNNIGCALYELNELDVARVAFEEALAIQRQNLRDKPIESTDLSNHSLLSIASTLSNIGSIKLYTGMYDEASVDLEEALLIQQCVFGDNHPIPKQTEESLKWIEDSRSIFHSLPIASAMDILSQLTGSLSMRSSGGDEGSSVFSCTTPSDSFSGSNVGPSSLTSNMLGSVEERFIKFQAKLENACGNDQSNEQERTPRVPKLPSRNSETSQKLNRRLL